MEEAKHVIKETAKTLLGLDPIKEGLARTTTHASIGEHFPHHRNVKEGASMAQDNVAREPVEDASFMSRLTVILSVLLSIVIIIGGVIPYIPQYIKINAEGNADGFSTHVCLALLTANTLRILFWFGHPFEIPLLLQSIVMILAMFIILELCVRTRQKNNITPVKPRYFLDFEWKYFWKWTDFISYIEAWATFTVIMGTSMYFFIGNPFFVEFTGFAALLMEAMLAVPQFIKNHQNKSTVGMSFAMVALWFVGDVTKTIYFVCRGAPVQFLVCGLIQVTLDILIFHQVYLYQKPSVYKLAKEIY